MFDDVDRSQPTPRPTDGAGAPRPASPDARAMRVAAMLGIGFQLLSVAWDYLVAPWVWTRLLQWRGAGVALLQSAKTLALIRELSDKHTILLSTHILPDVEMTCDRVAMVFAGHTRSVGPLGELLSARVLSTEVVLHEGTGIVGVLPAPPPNARVRQTPEGTAFDLDGRSDVDEFLRAAVAVGARILAVSPRRESLEDVFIRQAGEGRSEEGAGGGGVGEGRREQVAAAKGGGVA